MKFSQTMRFLAASAIAASVFVNPVLATAQDGLPEPGDFSEPVEMQLSGMVTKGRAVDGNWVQTRLEEMFNIKIENTFTDTWDSTQNSIMVASNDLPDAFNMTGGGLTPLEFYQDGLTRSIPREMIEKYAPLYTAAMNELESGLGWRISQNPDNPDEQLYLIGVQPQADGLLWVPSLRMDWLENLGFEIPEDAEPIGDSDGYERIYWTDTSYSLDELEEILTAFTFDDPDGNGQDDTYGILPTNDNLLWAQTLLGAYGLSADYNLLENDTLTDPMVSERYKEWLLKMNDWYNKGIMDPEWTTLSTQMAWEKYSNNQIGYFIAQKTYLAQESWTDGRAPQNILDANPEAKILAFHPETGPYGDQGQQSFYPVTFLGDAMQIGADVTDEELARYLQIYDFMTYNPEGVWTTYGIPGEHSDWRGEEGKSTLIVRPEYDLEEGEMGFWSYSPRSYPGDRYLWLTEMKTLELMERFFTVPEYVEAMAIRPYKHDLFTETDYADLVSRYDSQLTTLESEFRMNGITNVIDIEADWDNYVDTWMNNGGREILAELEKAPVVEDLRSGNFD
ncbi:type 2 periplasmic-binding domain-containing protein [Fundicoccus culcitae]|uniref:ABC transporter substrate-binding protein n=1 Tax=Fundicoccus culcitae TaxID=2969821 RepID=A0ABY5P8Q8_9LACT|nr:ABC transporter substrate-binding protein [Fundicoccus culcitae]UUX35127.1 ABC transporter substrate-binding protein [Fundicoccus culcitae]